MRFRAPRPLAPRSRSRHFPNCETVKTAPKGLNPGILTVSSFPRRSRRNRVLEGRRRGIGLRVRQRRLRLRSRRRVGPGRRGRRRRRRSHPRRARRLKSIGHLKSTGIGMASVPHPASDASHRLRAACGHCLGVSPFRSVNVQQARGPTGAGPNARKCAQGKIVRNVTARTSPGAFAGYNRVLRKDVRRYPLS
jgi:hypothetical protein